jgi:hypothetical protein
MVSETRTVLSRGELASLARKLDAFIQSLDPQEAEFVNQMLADAADAANEDASGYATLSTLADTDDVEAHAMGIGPVFGALAGYSLGVQNAEDELAGISQLTQPRS